METRGEGGDGLDAAALMDRIRRGMEERRQRGELYEDEAADAVEPWLERRAVAGAEQHPSWMDAVEDWDLEPECELSSHRRRLGGVIVTLKRILVRPFVKWLQDWVEANFLRQRRTNRALLQLVGDLAARNRRLDARVARLEARCRDLDAGSGQQGQDLPSGTAPRPDVG